MPQKDSDRPIDDDWLAAFARVSETRSDPEMQAYFARILAGEIKAPGSFSPVTLDVAATLTTEVAKLFQTFCNASSAGLLTPAVLIEPFGGNHSGNALASIGLPYDVLTQLRDMRLVQHDLTAYITAPLSVFTRPFEIGGAPFIATRRDPANLRPDVEASMPIHALTFTRAGRELRRIVFMTPNQLMVEKLAAFLQAFDLVLGAS